jgi:hypothetical protein
MGLRVSAVYRRCGFLLLILFSFSLPSAARTTAPAPSLCEVLRSPEKFDKQTIQLRGNVYLAFEDFSFASKECPNQYPGIWLAFGGDVATPTMSTANDTVRPAGTVHTFDGIPVPLVKDDNFDQLFALISARHGSDPLYNVSATLTGVFFAGRVQSSNNGRPGRPGWGHMGCCFLFVVSRVDAVDAVPPPRLDVSGKIADASGTAVAGVYVYAQTVNCCQPRLMQTRSDDYGSFAIKNAGQVLTFLKAGYRPKSVVLEFGRNELHVVLESNVSSDWRIPSCQGEPEKPQFAGLPLRVTIPRGLHSEQVTKQPEAPFIIHARPAQPFIRLSRGNSGAPFGETALRIFGSTEFIQRNVLSADGKPIGIDTSGSPENEKKLFWRILAIPGQELVEYYTLSQETAELFDRLIDSACFQTH